MNPRRARISAVTLLTVALGPWPARAAGGEADVAQADAARDVARIEEQVAAVERSGLSPDEPAASRAQRRFEEGVFQFELEDWLHAAVLLSDAVDEPAWRDAPERPRALRLLADALRRRDLCGAARLRYAEWLALDLPDDRAAVLSGALQCAVTERRHGDVERLLAEAERAFRGAPPADILYLAAKSAWQRRDLAPAERVAAASAAFERVGPPFQLHAWYFQGVLRIEAGDVDGALGWFGRCAAAEPKGGSAAAEPKGGSAAEVRELCQLALGRIHGQRGAVAAAVNWYAAIPWDSTRFLEAMQELSSVYVRGKEFDQALRLSAIISELDPESPHAPQATLLQGQLHLRLGHFSRAGEAFNVVINTYAPVRDEIDAVLATQGDPIRYFDELVGRPGGGRELAPVLPAVAARWATQSHDVSMALGLVRGLDEAHRDVTEARDVADRMEVLLQRSGGLDALPALQRSYAEAHAAETAAALAEGRLVEALSAAAAPALPVGARAELDAARGVRQALEGRVEAMPTSPASVDSRLARMRRHLDTVDRGAYQLGFHVEASLSAIAGSESWIDQHRADRALAQDPEARQEILDELRKQRGIVEGYAAEVAALRQEIAQARDAAGGVEAVAQEARLRAGYLAAVGRERAAAEPASGLLPSVHGVFERVDQARERLAALRARAQAAETAIAARAAHEGAALRRRILEDRGLLDAGGAALAAVQADAEGMLRAIAVRSVGEVRAQFYELVLQADVGIVDVAWSRKRQRLERIQGVAAQKDAEVEQLDREFRGVLREVE